MFGQRMVRPADVMSEIKAPQQILQRPGGD
jgi:hypothetical protein